jgi:hypothetical protein
MRFCSANCFTLVWNNDHYDAYTENRAVNIHASSYFVVSFTKDSVILDRRDDYHARVTGRISDQGNSLVNGRIEWLNHYDNKTFACQLTWGDALDSAQNVPTVPLSPAAENVSAPTPNVSRQVSQKHGGDNSALPGYRFFQYPGTNFPTQLTAINDKGVAVGFFTRPLDASCEPGAFGGPCPPSDREADMAQVPGSAYRSWLDIKNLDGCNGGYATG